MFDKFMCHVVPPILYILFGYAIWASFPLDYLVGYLGLGLGWTWLDMKFRANATADALELAIREIEALNIRTIDLESQSSLSSDCIKELQDKIRPLDFPRY